MILREILEHKTQEVADLEASVPLAEVRARAFDSPPPRDFTSAVTRKRADTGIREPLKAIAEIKRASPSAGLIRKSLSVPQIAASYQAAGASAISVLTDRRFFHGSLEDLAAARAAIELPVLRKEFIITPYQIYESRAHRADAVLLIAAALEGAQLQELFELAVSLSLHPLVEIHTLAELETAKATGAALIGINNRDLTTLETRLDTTFALLPSLPRGAVVVSESGIRRPEDVRRLNDAGVDAILVGEALLSSEDPGGRLRELLAGAPAERC